MLCFRQTFREFSDTFDEGCDCLSLMVSTRSDLQATNNGTGKVFAIVVTKTPSYQLHVVAESFPDYLFQYIATVTTTDGLAVINSENVMTALPKSQGPPISILSPEAK